MIYLLNNSRYFDFVIKGLDECFLELNIEYKLVDTYQEDSNNIYILCTTHEQRPLPKKYISYNFEQLTTDKIWDSHFFDKLKNAVEVWDYSLENIKILESKGIKCKFLPLGITNTIDYNINREIDSRKLDFLFYGCINDNRINKLKNLLQIYYKTPEKYFVSNNCWGNDLIQKMSETRIGINIHFYTGNTILEIHRIYPMIINRVWVISETSNDSWYDEKLKDYITFCDNKDLIKNIMLILKLSVEDFERILEERRTKIIKELKYKDFIKDNLKNSIIYK